MNDVAYGNGSYIAVGASINFSTDKLVWNPSDVDFGEASCVTYADAFYVGVNGVGIFTYADEMWAQVYTGNDVFTDAINAGGVPVFATSTGKLLTGPQWTETAVSSGRIKLAYSDRLWAVVNGIGTLEVFAGTNANSLVSLGTNEIEEIEVTATSYDSVNKCVVVSGYATDDASPFFYVFKGGVWTFIFSELETHASALTRNALTAGHTLYRTSDYLTFDVVHTFDTFEPAALIYA